jgi:hypothetical protein
MVLLNTKMKTNYAKKHELHSLQPFRAKNWVAFIPITFKILCQRIEEEEFQSLLLQVEAKILNSWRSGGLTLLQKCCSAGLGMGAECCRHFKGTVSRDVSTFWFSLKRRIFRNHDNCKKDPRALRLDQNYATMFSINIPSGVTVSLISL